MNVVGLKRVSTQGKAKDGFSLTYQEDEYTVKNNGRSNIIKVLIQQELKKNSYGMKSINSF